MVQPFGYDFAADLAGRGSGQIGFRPEDPAAQVLELRQPFVGVLDGRGGLVAGAAHGEHGTWLGAGGRLDGDDGAGADTRL